MLDPETGTVVRTARLPGDSPYGIDRAQGGVFVALHDEELLRIDPRDESTERLRLGNGLTQLLATNEAVWVSRTRAPGTYGSSTRETEPSPARLPTRAASRWPETKRRGFRMLGACLT